MLFEGLADTAEEAEAKLARGDGITLEPCHHRDAVGPMAGVISPVDVGLRAARRGARRHVLVLAQRGPRQGAALRRLRPRGDRPAALDERRARPDPPAGGPRAHGPIDIKAIIAQMLQMGDEGHNRNRAGSLMLLRELLPSLIAADAPSADIAEAVRFSGANEHFFLNLGMPACKLATVAAHGIPGSTRGHDDGPQRHRLRHPGVRHRRRVVHRPGQHPRGPVPRVLRPGRRQPRHRRLGDHRDRRHRRLRDGRGSGDRASSSAATCRSRCGPRRRCTRSPLASTRPTRCRSSSSGARPPASTSPASRAPASCRRSTPAWPVRVAGTGQVGAGLVTPPAECFPAALAALAKAVPATA